MAPAPPQCRPRQPQCRCQYTSSGFETIDLIARGDGRIGTRLPGAARPFGHRLRHQRRGSNTSGEYCRACGNAKRDLQEIPAFHDIFLVLSDARKFPCCGEMPNGR